MAQTANGQGGLRRCLALGLFLLNTLIAAGQPWIGGGCVDREFDTTSSVGADLNGDGINDIEVRQYGHWAQYCMAPWESWVTSWIASPNNAEFLISTSTSFPAILALGTKVSAVPPAGAEWRQTGMLLRIVSTNGLPASRSGLLAMQDTLFVAARFKTPLGLHYAWMKLSVFAAENRWVPAIVDHSYQPIPGTEATIGEHAELPPPNPNVWITNQPISLLRPLDLVLETRRWRNDAELKDGIEVILRAIEPAKVLSRDNLVSDGEVVEPVGLDYFRRIPQTPISPDAWIGFRQIPILTVERTYDPSTGDHVTTKRGPLANGPMAIGIMTTILTGPVRTFPLYFDAEGQLEGVYKDGSAYPVVGSRPVGWPSRKPASESAVVDLNQDGRFDFILRYDGDPNYGSAQVTSFLNTVYLEALGANRLGSAGYRGFGFFLEPLPRGFVIGPSSWPTLPDFVSERSWRTNSGVLRTETYFCAICTPGSVVVPDVTEFQTEGTRTGFFASRTPGYVGVEFEADDGKHYGWLLFIGTQLADFDFNPAPDQPIRVGERLTNTHPRLVIRPGQNGNMLLTWESKSPVWEVERRLDLRPTTKWESNYGASWQQVGENVFRMSQEVPMVGRFGLFRLVIPGVSEEPGF